MLRRRSTTKAPVIVGLVTVSFLAASSVSGGPASRLNRALQSDEPVEEQTDELIEAAVREALLLEPELESFGLGVEVDDGVVILRGVVDTENSSAKASEIARSVKGVDDVENLILVRAQVKVPDAELEESIEAALSRDPEVKRRNIVVTVLDGAVTLHGTVESEAEKKRATEVALRIHGAREVENQLKVEPENPLVEKSDAEIEAALRKRLSKSPVAGLGRVEVLVEDGLVTLEGAVPTRKARNTAEDLAFESGAVLVENRLEVEKDEK